MIYWITGKPNSGKTTLAYKIAKQINGIVLDGDDIRKIFPDTFKVDGRQRNQKRLVDLAILLDKQGFNVVIACVSPNKSYRGFLQKGFEKGCIEIQMPFGKLWPGTKYED